MVKAINKKSNFKGSYQIEIVWDSGWSEWIKVNRETYLKEEYK